MEKSPSDHKGPPPTKVNAKSSSVGESMKPSKEEFFNVVRDKGLPRLKKKKTVIGTVIRVLLTLRLTKRHHGRFNTNVTLPLTCQLTLQLRLVTI